MYFWETAFSKHKKQTDFFVLSSLSSFSDKRYLEYQADSQDEEEYLWSKFSQDNVTQCDAKQDITEINLNKLHHSYNFTIKSATMQRKFSKDILVSNRFLLCVKGIVYLVSRQLPPKIECVNFHTLFFLFDHFPKVLKLNVGPPQRLIDWWSD